MENMIFFYNNGQDGYLTANISVGNGDTITNNQSYRLCTDEKGLPPSFFSCLINTVKAINTIESFFRMYKIRQGFLICDDIGNDNTPNSNAWSDFYSVYQEAGNPILSNRERAYQQLQNEHKTYISAKATVLDFLNRFGIPHQKDSVIRQSIIISVSGEPKLITYNHNQDYTFDDFAADIRLLYSSFVLIAAQHYYCISDLKILKSVLDAAVEIMQISCAGDIYSYYIGGIMDSFSVSDLIRVVSDKKAAPLSATEIKIADKLMEDRNIDKCEALLLWCEYIHYVVNLKNTSDELSPSLQKYSSRILLPSGKQTFHDMFSLFIPHYKKILELYVNYYSMNIIKETDSAKIKNATRVVLTDFLNHNARPAVTRLIVTGTKLQRETVFDTLFDGVIDQCISSLCFEKQEYWICNRCGSVFFNSRRGIHKYCSKACKNSIGVANYRKNRADD